MRIFKGTMALFSRAHLVIGAALIVMGPVGRAQSPILSPCDYTAAQSQLIELNVQGNAQWFEDRFRDDRGNAMTGTVQADFTQLMDSPSTGHRLDGRGQLKLSPGEVEPRIDLSGSFKRYFSGSDTFWLGASDLKTDLAGSAGADLTAGMGKGRFRDVTPLAKAIRTQNKLLDIGALRGPLRAEILQEMAHVLDGPGLTADEKIENLERILEGTGLVAEGGLGATALLQMEKIIVSQEEARLCGSEVQASIGFQVSGLPAAMRVREALVLKWNYAVVPDPRSQWTANAQWNTGVDLLEQFVFQASAAYNFRLGENWRGQTGYAFTREQPKEQPPTDRHHLTGRISYQLSSPVSLTLNGDLVHETGFEEPRINMAAQLSYAVF